METDRDVSMLLFEVIASADKPSPQDAIKAAFAKGYAISAMKVNVGAKIKPEEAENFKAIGINADDWNVNVLFAYEMGKRKGDEFEYARDALKLRRGYENDPDVIRTIEQRASQFANLLLHGNMDTMIFGNKGRASTKNFRRMADDSRQRETILVTLPSSSRLPSMLAHALAQELSKGAGRHVKIVSSATLFKKNPKLSRESLTAEQRSQLKVYWDQIESEIQELRDMLDATPDATPAEIASITHEIEKKKNQLENLGEFKRKNFYQVTSTNRGEAFYNWIGVNPSEFDIKKLHPVNVILVDDNVVEGDTIADAAKSLVAHGKKPMNVMGVVLHKLATQSPKSISPEPEARGLIKPHVEGCTFSALRALLG